MSNINESICDKNVKEANDLSFESLPRKRSLFENNPAFFNKKTKIGWSRLTLKELNFFFDHIKQRSFNLVSLIKLDEMMESKNDNWGAPSYDILRTYLKNILRKVINEEYRYTLSEIHRQNDPLNEKLKNKIIGYYLNDELKILCFHTNLYDKKEFPIYGFLFVSHFNKISLDVISEETTSKGDSFDYSSGGVSQNNSFDDKLYSLFVTEKTIYGEIYPQIEKDDKYYPGVIPQKELFPKPPFFYDYKNAYRDSKFDKTLSYEINIAHILGITESEYQRMCEDDGVGKNTVPFGNAPCDPTAQYGMITGNFKETIIITQTDEEIKRKKRIPTEFQTIEKNDFKILLELALQHTFDELSRDPRIAVPQYFIYDIGFPGEIQLVAPVSLSNNSINDPDCVCIIKKKKNPRTYEKTYYVSTILPRAWGVRTPRGMGPLINAPQWIINISRNIHHSEIDNRENTMNIKKIHEYNKVHLEIMRESNPYDYDLNFSENRIIYVKNVPSNKESELKDFFGEIGSIENLFIRKNPIKEIYFNVIIIYTYFKDAFRAIEILNGIKFDPNQEDPMIITQYWNQEDKNKPSHQIEYPKLDPMDIGYTARNLSFHHDLTNDLESRDEPRNKITNQSINEPKNKSKNETNNETKNETKNNPKNETKNRMIHRTTNTNTNTIKNEIPKFLCTDQLTPSIISHRKNGNLINDDQLIDSNFYNYSLPNPLKPEKNFSLI